MSGPGAAPLALVTGGCRRLGAVIAARLADAGWALALHSRDGGPPEPTLATHLADGGTEWRAHAADLAVEDERAGLLAAVEAAWQRPVALLVNNAAPFADDDWRTMTAACLHDQFGVAAAAPILLTRDLALRAEADGRRAAAVLILDQRIAHPHGDQASYTVAKLALAGAVPMLATACAPHLRVNGVAPGLALPTPDYTPGQLERLGRRMPIGALPTPDQVADAVVWLAAAGATTGQVLYVDGGAHLESFGADFLRLERD